MGEKQSFSNFQLCAMHSDHTNMVRNIDPAATCLFHPEELIKLSLQSLSQSKRGCG